MSTPARTRSTRDLDAPARRLTVRWEDPVAMPASRNGLSGLDAMNAIRDGTLPPPPMAVLIGLEPIELGEGRCVFAGHPGEEHYNPLGTVHGGFAATLLDSAMGCAVQTTLPPEATYTTLDLQLRFVRPISRETGEVRAEGVVVHRGSRVATAEGRLEQAGTGRLLAHGTCTCLVVLT